MRADRAIQLRQLALGPVKGGRQLGALGLAHVVEHGHAVQAVFMWVSVRQMESSCVSVWSARLEQSFQKMHALT